MTEKKDLCGVGYTLDVLEDKWQPRIIYWLGFRPFSIDELQQLLPDLTAVALNDELASLQNLRIVNPVKNNEGKYSLTEDGNDLRNMVVTMGVWGRQQMDDSADKASAQIVEPEANASMAELIKYNEKLGKYL
ncbi:helix-turn-helix transcriptional regulator [Limosilactobacillus sp. STM2_1]|uniref:Helix-turn-helix transcriptional regulator n=1 Tax=Limosilactobacillus rudii TaxID=2759755 RepID=A0A7W3YN02_9LACO|nr:helix-turn-helix domain-containing protein [Limosilactobacillus rudii]MBB1080284.1 helix-turn-helix transcriptional regulator [Limosilactobacillus rudii]MBB1096812.1 helix-turn-helix transcriptional regulator [Limosilactobacillus rudii]MCD7133709.1 helix-turn-helix transcriptional regulator [Limosilactobacillus rudii]